MVQLETILERYPRPWRPTNARPAPVVGGFSGSTVWKVESPAGHAALKRWNAEATRDRVNSIHQLLAAIAAQGLDILATPIPTTDAKTCFQADGRLWELSHWMPGEATVGDSGSAERIRAAAEAIAQWRNAADRCIALPNLEALSDARLAEDFRCQRFVSSPAIARRRAEHSRIRDRLVGMERSLTQSAADHRARVAARKTFEAVRRNIAIEDQLNGDFRGPVTIALRDVHREHLLFSGDRVTGLIDFGAIAIDSPAVDLARLLGSLAPDDGSLWEEGFAAYRKIAPLEPHDLEHARLLDRSGTLIAALRWMEWLLVERRPFANPEAALERWESLAAKLEQWGMSE